MASYELVECSSEKEDCHLISNGRQNPSVIASATSSSSSVASTRKLIPSVKRKKDYLQDEKMTQKERNLLLTNPAALEANEKKVVQAPPQPEQQNITIDKLALFRQSLYPVCNTMRVLMRADTHPHIDVVIANGNEKAAVYTLAQALAAFAVSLCSAVVGFSSAYTSPALVSMNQPESRIHVSDQEASWIGSLMPLSALIGGVMGGPLIDIIGRKTTILATAVPFIISFLSISFAMNVAMVMAGRVIAGFCVGIASLALPVYLGEALQPEVRGTFGLFPTTIGNFGILLCFFLGKYLDWTQLALFGAVLPVPFFVLMFFIPETPRWYIGKEKEKRAQKSLQWLRGRKADVSKELAELQKSGEADNETAVKFTELFSRKYIVPISISMGLMFFQQMSGINAVIFYTVSIFEDAGSTIDSNLSSIIVGLVNLGSTLVATFLIDRLGRKVLMYISNSIMIATLGTLGGFFYFKSQGVSMTEYGWIPLASFVLFVVGFSVGAGPIPWLMMGEILPARIRGTAASLVTAFNWACTFIVTKTFSDIVNLVGSHGAFWFFCIICVFGLFFVIIFVPETQGRSLEDIEKRFKGEKVEIRTERRHSSITNIKPLPTI